MTHAYEETYLADAMNNLGDMFDYAINTLGHEPEQFYSKFITSKIAAQFGRGNPKFVAGLSGPEIALEVLRRTGFELEEIPSPPVSADQTPEFRAGRALAYYQWFTARTFAYTHDNGLTFDRILPLYEADLPDFVAAAESIVEENNNHVRLAQVRQYTRTRPRRQKDSSVLCKLLYNKRNAPEEPEDTSEEKKKTQRRRRNKRTGKAETTVQTEQNNTATTEQKKAAPTEQKDTNSK